MRYIEWLQLCGSSSWIIPLGLAMPYLWRLFQCIRVYKDTGNQGQVCTLTIPGWAV